MTVIDMSRYFGSGTYAISDASPDEIEEVSEWGEDNEVGFNLGGNILRFSPDDLTTQVAFKLRFSDWFARP